MNSASRVARFGFLTSLFFLCLGTAVADKVTATTGRIDIPTYPWAAVQHPYFRGTDRVNIYPYPMMDFLSRDRTNRSYRTVVLENRYLRITFLPELGGRIHEVINKTTGQPVFYVNHVIKPGLIGQCGAWISGGVEWNTGPQGHTVSCLQPAAVRILPRAADGSQSVAIGETERIYGTKWTVVVTLRPDRSFIEERIRIYNPTVYVRPYYFWNCTAVPNTPGFRFIYPMTLGCDHAGETFFNWPVDKGRDLTRGTNYQDAASIFAWHCDQDFFGSYNDDLDRGVVSCADHRQLPGKKAWTWGQGGFGKMHQMDLTDEDGPYNEVQTGPLLTQAQVGRLDPCEAVEWQEWWYPIHALGGFTYANRNLAVNAEREGDRVSLRVLGTGTWRGVKARVAGAETGQESVAFELSPRAAARVALSVAGFRTPTVELVAGGEVLASFQVPLNLPSRQPPGKKPAGDSPGDLVRAGWEDYLFARFPEAEAKFNRALAQDSRQAGAHTGLALLRLDGDPAAAASAAGRALEFDAGAGLAHLIRAEAALRQNDGVALDHAWNASLDPATAIAGRALAAQALLWAKQWRETVALLSAPGPWQADPLCRNRLALAQLRLGNKAAVAALARENLQTDPLDGMASALLWLAGAGKEARPNLAEPGREVIDVLDLAAQFVELKQNDLGARLLRPALLDPLPAARRDRLVASWAKFLGVPEGPAGARPGPAGAPESPTWPHRLADETVLRSALEGDPGVSLDLGHVLFHLGRHDEARDLWQKAAEAGANPSIAYRALGMAARNLDGDLERARAWLRKANDNDPGEAIIARDLANVDFALAEKQNGASEKQALVLHARDVLQRAFAAGKGRSDFVALLARANNRLGNFAETARMLDGVRVTVWEGSHEVHDLFEQAHLALGEAGMAANRPADALREFDRALEYPANLATGKLENKRQAHIQYQRGRALAALGQTEAAREAWRTAANEPESADKNIESARQKARQALAEQ